MELQIDRVRNFLFLPFIFALIYCGIRTHLQMDTMWEYVVEAQNRTGQCTNLHFLTVTDTTCTIKFNRWLIRTTMIPGFFFSNFFAPYLLTRIYTHDKNFLAATTLERSAAKSLANLAAKSFILAYDSALLCLYILDVVVMDDEDYAVERTQNFKSLMRYTASPVEWLFHLGLYHGFIIFSLVHASAMLKLMRSLDNTFVDPDLVTKARNQHGYQVKTILYTVTLITGPLSLLAVWLDFFVQPVCIDYMFTLFAFFEWVTIINNITFYYLSIGAIANEKVAFIIPHFHGPVDYIKVCRDDDDAPKRETIKFIPAPFSK